MNEILITIAETFGPSVLVVAIASLALWGIFRSFIKSQGTQISNLSNDNKEIRAELKERREEASEERQRSKEYRQRLELLTAEVETLQKSLTEERDRTTKLLKRIGSLSEQVTKIKSEHTSAIERIDGLASSIAEFTHYLEHSKSIDPNIIRRFEKTLNDHGQELVRLKEIVQRLHPSSEKVHKTVLSVFGDEQKTVSSEDLEAVLKSIILDKNESS